ncbi:MAG: DUF3159 domain-containing protein [Hyphomicrobiales bacterium]
MNYRIITSSIPVALFYAFTKFGPSWLAIAVSFVATAIVTYANRQDRIIGVLAVYGFVIVAVCAVIGIAANDEKTYLAAGPISDFLFVPLYAGSVFIGRPLVGGIARELAPALTHRIPQEAPIFAWLSLMWAAHNLVQGFFRLWLLGELSVGQYIVLSRLLNWPVSGTLIAITAWFIYREARRYGTRLEGEWWRWRPAEAATEAR